MATRLPAHGWTITVACPEGPMAAATRAAGVDLAIQPWRTIRGISDKSSGRKRYQLGGVVASVRDTMANAAMLTRLVGEMRPDVVMSNSLPTHIVVAIAGRRTGRPTVWYLRDIVDPGPGRRLVDLMGRRVDLMIAISQDVAESTVHETVRVPQSVERDNGDTSPIELPPTHRRRLGYIGRIDPRKGVEDLLLAAKHLDVEVVVAGAPVIGPASYADGLRQLAEEVAPGRVTFLGAVPSPWPVLEVVDVLVVPSRREPWGRVAAEALIAGVPVVAAAAGGLREIVRDGVDGLFYPPGDVDALVAQLSSLLDDPSRLGRFAEAAREGSVRFEPDRNDGIVAGVLDRVVCTHRTARRGTAR
jgi:glycosyltransferase involved in cell wall biosynthesis